MPSTFRIPRAELDGPMGRLMAAWTRRRFGQVPDGAYVGWHHRKLMADVFSFERKVARWRALDPHLKTYAQLASAAMIGCSWCVDFGYYLAHQDGLDEAKVSQVPRWRQSDLFDETERAVLTYAEAMTAQPPEVTDAMVAGLVDRLGVKAVVELTQMVALENMRSRFNCAAGLASQGFSAVCSVPLAVPSHE